MKGQPTASAVQDGAGPHAASTIVELFAAAAERFADRPAVRDDAGQALTYAELDRVSADLARRLIAEGVGREDRVGIHRERDVDLVVSILGALRAGAAYVAVDLRYPQARRELMLREAGCRVVLVGADPQLPRGTDLPVLTWEYGADADQDADSNGDATAGSNGSAGPGRLPDPAPEDAGCVLFTSGSTGTPKGVVVEHRNLVHFGTNSKLPQIMPEDRVAQTANVSFDTFHYELWCSFAAGAQVVMMPSVPDLVKGDPGRALRRRRITVMLAPTMAFNHIAIEDPDVFASLRMLLTGGDVIRPAACRSVLARGFEGSLTNLYGPTEGTTAATGHDISEVAADATSVPIGSGLAGVELRVLDANLSPVPPGTPGELYIGGAGVTRGYLRDPARTAERFLPDPFGAPGSAMYATGDIVCQRDDGVLDFLGRNDGQVKVRGYRVEPREVERSLMSCPGMLDATVLPRGDDQDRKLIAVVVAEGDLTLAELRAFAERTMPDYQVPSEFVQVEEIPATPHGKRDAAALSALLADRERARSDYVAPRTDIERYLARTWEEMLGSERISVTDDFFAMGGNSMLAFRMSRRIARDRAPAVMLEDLLANTVLADMALAVDAAASKGKEGGLAP